MNSFCFCFFSIVMHWIVCFVQSHFPLNVRHVKIDPFAHRVWHQFQMIQWIVFVRIVQYVSYHWNVRNPCVMENISQCNQIHVNAQLVHRHHHLLLHANSHAQNWPVYPIKSKFGQQPAAIVYNVTMWYTLMMIVNIENMINNKALFLFVFPLLWHVDIMNDNRLKRNSLLVKIQVKQKKFRYKNSYSLNLISIQRDHLTSSANCQLNRRPKDENTNLCCICKHLLISGWLINYLRLWSVFSIRCFDCLFK